MMESETHTVRNMVQAALVIEVMDPDGDIKRLIYGFDPRKEFTMTFETDYDLMVNLFQPHLEIRNNGMKITVEGWSGNPRVYNGPMPVPDQPEIEETKQITDGNDEIIIEEDELGEWNA